MGRGGRPVGKPLPPRSANPSMPLSPTLSPRSAGGEREKSLVAVSRCGRAARYATRSHTQRRPFRKVKIDLPQATSTIAQRTKFIRLGRIRSVKTLGQTGGSALLRSAVERERGQTVGLSALRVDFGAWPCLKACQPMQTPRTRLRMIHTLDEKDRGQHIHAGCSSKLRFDPFPN